jgi:predicted secreted protein
VTTDRSQHPYPTAPWPCAVCGAGPHEPCREVRASRSAPPAQGRGEIEALREEMDRLAAALGKVNEIRNSIIGLQTMNWSEHVYPLVAALDDAGIQGQPYAEARARFGTMLERTVAAESALAAQDGLRERVLEEAARTVAATEPAFAYGIPDASDTLIRAAARVRALSTPAAPKKETEHHE